MQEKEANMRKRDKGDHLRNETQSMDEDSNLSFDTSDKSEGDQARSTKDLNVFQSKTDKHNWESAEEVDHESFKLAQGLIWDGRDVP